MRKFSFVAAGLVFIGAPVASGAYPIDCAILLCLAGGFPSSPDCSAAKIEMIRRITPWPVEPPLQIWRCPMGAAYQSLPQDPWARLYRVSGEYSTENGTADTDISGSTFDFVRAIRVYDVSWNRYPRKEGSGSDGNWVCEGGGRVRVGSYGQQGDYAWSNIDITALPSWVGVDLRSTARCDNEGRFRGIGIGWSDAEGHHDFEVVEY